ncbi:MAG: tRNA preQ1(34) S-adenosylmethionine ribosyltransferase-isomerase QueA [Candidatus Saliniplasma sp.]
MKLSDFDYDLDEDLIAQKPARPRHDSRLFYLKRSDSKHLKFSDLPGLLKEGDVLVKNRSKVIPARVKGRKDTGGKVEILFYRAVDDGWLSLVKGNNIQVGRKLFVENEPIDIIDNKKEGMFILDCEDPWSLMQEYGEMPTPPYIKKEIEKAEEYQTIYAEDEGSIAAPTAGLHFTEDILEELDEKGVQIYDVVLHVGPGTFLPVHQEEIDNHVMGEEYYEIPENTAKGITKANEDDRRVILVGTTTVRAIETASKNGVVYSEKGWTDLFIRPGYEFESGMDLLLTNFHLPKSTLIMLVSAFAGRERILNAYKEAVERKYRFYSFGDAMLMEGKNDRF